MKAVIDLGLISLVLSVLSFLGLIVYVIYNEVKKHIEDLHDQEIRNNIHYHNDAQYSDLDRRISNIEDNVIIEGEE